MSDWQDELTTDELKTNPTLRNFDSPEAAYQGLIDLKAKQGNMIRLSSDDAGDDERAANREKIMKAHPDLMLRPDFTDEAATKDYLAYIGVPAEAKDYEIPENTLPPEWLNEIVEGALAEELTPRQLNKRIDGVNKLHTEQQEAHEAAVAEATQEQKSKWGAAYDERMKQVEWVSKEFFAEFGELGEMNSVAIQGLYKISQAIKGKGAQVHNQPNEPASAISPEEAVERVNEIRQKIIDNKNPNAKEKLTKQLIDMQKLTNPAAYA